MEFPYHFAHMKSPWFTHHENSMTTHGIQNMVILLNIHWFNVQFSMEYPWLANHGNFMWAKWYENSMETWPEFLSHDARPKLEPATSWSQVRYSTTTPQRHPWCACKYVYLYLYCMQLCLCIFAVSVLCASWGCCSLAVVYICLLYTSPSPRD